MGYLDLALRIMKRLPAPPREAGLAVNAGAPQERVGAGPPARAAGPGADVWDAGLLRLVEADLGLRPGSLQWIDPPGRRCPGCPWCQ